MAYYVIIVSGTGETETDYFCLCQIREASECPFIHEQLIPEGNLSRISWQQKYFTIVWVGIRI